MWRKIKGYGGSNGRGNMGSLVITGWHGAEQRVVTGGGMKKILALTVGLVALNGYAATVPQPQVVNFMCEAQCPSRLSNGSCPSNAYLSGTWEKVTFAQGSPSAAPPKVGDDCATAVAAQIKRGLSIKSYVPSLSGPAFMMTN